MWRIPDLGIRRNSSNGGMGKYVGDTYVEALASSQGHKSHGYDRVSTQAEKVISLCDSPHVWDTKQLRQQGAYYVWCVQVSDKTSAAGTLPSVPATSSMFPYGKVALPLNRVASVEDMKFNKVARSSLPGPFKGSWSRVIIGVCIVIAVGIVVEFVEEFVELVIGGR